MEAETAELPVMTVATLLEQGGVILYVIIALSVATVGYAIYCALMLRRRVMLPATLVELAESLRPRGDIDAAVATCRQVGGAFAEVLLTVIVTRQIRREEAEALVESAGRRAAHDISRGVLALEIIAAIAPLLGLLGTVLGMYEVFRKIAAVGVREAGALSGGISEALVTTIAGLIVAIPAYVAFTWFSRRVDDMALEMERYAVRLMLRLRAEPAAGDGV